MFQKRENVVGLGFLVIEGVAKERGAKGLVWIKIQEDQMASPILVLTLQEQEDLRKRSGAQSGDLLLLVADESPNIVHQSMSHLRRHSARELGIIPKRTFCICLGR